MSRARTLRPCLDCGNPTFNTRCLPCNSARNRTRNANPRRQQRYGGDWPKQARQAIATHRATHGDVCPGWGRTPHNVPPTVWTCDHDLGPLCRSCNSRKAGTTETPR